MLSLRGDGIRLEQAADQELRAPSILWGHVSVGF